MLDVEAGEKIGEGVGRFRVSLTVANNEDLVLARRGQLPENEVRRVRLRGVVDSGAARLVLPLSVVKKLGLTPAGKIRVRYADRRAATRDYVEEVHVELQGRHGTFRALVEPGRRSALIGAIVLEDLDFLVDCTNQKLVPRDPRIMVSEIE